MDLILTYANVEYKIFLVVLNAKDFHDIC